MFQAALAVNLHRSPGMVCRYVFYILHVLKYLNLVYQFFQEVLEDYLHCIQCHRPSATETILNSMTNIIDLPQASRIVCCRCNVTASIRLLV